MKLILLHEAEIEFWQSVEYYERRRPGLGVRFKEEVDRYFECIGKQPLLPSMRKQGYRRVNLTVFRHYIAYAVRDDVIWVVAICHSHRRPEFWLGRLS